MRSLQEWQEYVERQIEAAKKRRGVEDAPNDAKAKAAAEPEAPAQSSTAAAETPASTSVTTVTPERKRPEGRALLTWEDTSPLQKTPISTPPPPPPFQPSSERLPAPETDSDNPLERLGLNTNPAPASTRHPLPEKSPVRNGTSEASPAPSHPTPSNETGGEVGEDVVPLKPYQPRDPRWRSSVEPPRTHVAPVALIPSPSKEPKIEAEAPAPTAPVEKGKAEVSIPEASAPQPQSGVIAAPPADTASTSIETSQIEALPTPAKRAKRLTAKRAETAPALAPETPEQLQDLWDRVPRHVQSLIRTQNDEVAQRSYKSFRESRETLISRLLDPELSLEEAARILGVCPTTVRRYTNRSLLPHHRTPGNQRRFRLSHVLEFMERYGHTLEGDRANDAAELESASVGDDASPSMKVAGEPVLRSDPQPRPS